MTRYWYAFVLILLCAASARAQEVTFNVQATTHTMVMTVLAPTGPVALVAAPAADALSWYPLGGSFGTNGTFRFGFDKSETASACGSYDIPDHIFLAGPCRDFLLLMHRGAPAFHLGAALGYGLADIQRSEPVWQMRLGINVGPATAAFLNYVGDNVPKLDAVGGLHFPAAVRYVGKITSADFNFGVNPHPRADHSKMPYGVGAKIDLPLNDVLALFK